MRAYTCIEEVNMAKVNVAFRFNSVLYRKFRKMAKQRGHTMTWYLEGCMREVVGEKRRGVIPVVKPYDLKSKLVKPLGKGSEPKRKKKS